MKELLAMTLIVLSAALCSAEEPSKVDTPEALAERFVDAIAHNDIDAAKECWLSADELKKFVANPPEGVDVSNIDDDDLAYVKKQWALRDKEITSRLSTLVAGLNKKGLDISRIQLLKATPKRPGTGNGLKSIQQLEIVMAIDDIRIEYRIGGAGLYFGRWRCVELCGSGATLIRNNRAESIQCEKPNKPGASDGK